MFVVLELPVAECWPIRCGYYNGDPRVDGMDFYETYGRFISQVVLQRTSYGLVIKIIDHTVTIFTDLRKRHLE